MRQLLFRPRAIADIEGIWDYTSRRWGVAQADRYVLSLRQACIAVARNELPGEDASHIRLGYRKQLSGRHVIFYRLNDQGAVEVVRVLHQRMDVVGHLRGDSS
jgi:toxin ParE1/3/4